MKNDFNKKVDRKGMASIRELTTPYEVKQAGVTSFWGAEFEFPMPKFIIKAIKSWINKGLVAYSCSDDDYYKLIKSWMKMHRDWDIEASWIVPTYGLTHSVGTICRAFTNVDDGIIGMNPVYHMTWQPVILNDRVHVDCPLIFEDEEYHIDYLALEKAMANPKNKVLAFCNPHNPIGKVWGKDDLKKIAELAHKHDVIIYSDEIFADTIYNHAEFHTFSQVAEVPIKWIAATSVGKTYSVTGIGQANIVIEDEALREAFIKQRNIDHYGSFDPMMRVIYFAGYTKQGRQWINEMMNYCYENYKLIDDFASKRIPEIKVIKPDGSYLLWIDCRGLGFACEAEYEQFFASALFHCDSGTTYGSEAGFIRMNLATPKKDLKKALDTLYKSVVKTRKVGEQNE